MTKEQRAQGHEGGGYGSRGRTIRLAVMLAAVAVTLFAGSFFFLTR